MFSQFQSIVNKVNVNRSADALEYTEHEKALKLLYTHHVNTIIESAGYETLTVNELFSKLKATEVDMTLASSGCVIYPVPSCLYNFCSLVLVASSSIFYI